MKYKTYNLEELVKIKYGKNQAKVVCNNGSIPIYGTGGLMGYSKIPLYDKPSVLIGRKGTINKVRYVNDPFWTVDTLFYTIINESLVLPKYLYYLLSTINFDYYNEGTSIPSLRTETLNKISLNVPCLEDQRATLSILSPLDDLIKANTKINDYLAQISKQYFNQYVENCTDYSEKSLTDIANYQNGLAMQKFRPTDNSNFLPVLKIRELSMGCCNQDSDKCTPDIKKECIVEDGDIIFSWSGSLMIDIWCGGKCGLNQHLFKVTSDSYPAWFIFYWTDYYMDNFREIAGDKATTMGHICRNHLEESIVKCPNNVTFESIDSIMGPLFEKRISLMKENRMLISIRNELLPKLMSGEIDVSKIDLSN